jgi:hypothetical protein
LKQLNPLIYTHVSGSPFNELPLQKAWGWSWWW